MEVKALHFIIKMMGNSQCQFQTDLFYSGTGCSFLGRSNRYRPENQLFRHPAGDFRAGSCSAAHYFQFQSGNQTQRHPGKIQRKTGRQINENDRAFGLQQLLCFL